MFIQASRRHRLVLSLPRRVSDWPQEVARGRPDWRTIRLPKTLITNANQKPRTPLGRAGLRTHCTISVAVVSCSRDPDVPVMVKVDVPVGVPGVLLGPLTPS